MAAAKQRTKQKLTALQIARYEDAEWALHNPEIQKRYLGQWVVAFDRKIIAHGQDVQSVLEKASLVVKDPLHHPIFCAPEQPELWLQHSSENEC